MLPSMMPRLDKSFREHEEGHLSLASAYFVPSRISSMGITPYLRGLARVPLEATDQMVVDEVRNMLFGPPGAGGLDLAALNIQRGRDHGLGSYNAVRRELGLAAALGFSDITSDTAVASALSTAYQGDIEAVDLWIGGMAEDHLAGAILGETFHWLWVDQFRRLRDGDPNWFENEDSISHPEPFQSEELVEIRSTTLAGIIAKNTEWQVVEGTPVFKLPPPGIVGFSADPSNGNIVLQWRSFHNASYRVEAAGDLKPGTPFDAIMTTTGADGATSVSFFDQGAIGVPGRFYRIIQR